MNFFKKAENPVKPSENIEVEKPVAEEAIDASVVENQEESISPERIAALKELDQETMALTKMSESNLVESIKSPEDAKKLGDNLDSLVKISEILGEGDQQIKEATSKLFSLLKNAGKKFAEETKRALPDITGVVSAGTLIAALAVAAPGYSEYVTRSVDILPNILFTVGTVSGVLSSALYSFRPKNKKEANNSQANTKSETEAA